MNAEENIAPPSHSPFQFKVYGSHSNPLLLHNGFLCKIWSDPNMNMDFEICGGTGTRNIISYWWAQFHSLQSPLCIVLPTKRDMKWRTRTAVTQVRPQLPLSVCTMVSYARFCQTHVHAILPLEDSSRSFLPLEESSRSKVAWTLLIRLLGIYEGNPTKWTSAEATVEERHATSHVSRRANPTWLFLISWQNLTTLRGRKERRKGEGNCININHV